jgi:uncharacterized protein YqjF (DUF2071 family)
VIDRIGPTRRPRRVVAGYQRWRSLLFMHWPVPVETLRPLVPNALEIDLFDGVAYVGVVPFAMQGVRPRWAPSFLGFNFLETNVRTYVTHGTQPGVYFFSLDAASRLAVWVARQFWGLPYYYADMQLEIKDDTVNYQSSRRASRVRHEVQCRLGQMLGPSPPDSIEFFFLERYLLFLERRHTLYTGQVHHTPYPAQQAELLHLHDELMTAAGVAGCEGPPAYTHYSQGVDVEIFGLEAS